MCFTKCDTSLVKKGYAWKVFRYQPATKEFFNILKDRRIPRKAGVWYKAERRPVSGINVLYASAFTMFVKKDHAMQVARWWNAMNYCYGYETVVVRVKYRDADLEGNVTWGYGHGNGLKTHTRQAAYIRIPVNNSIVHRFTRQDYERDRYDVFTHV